MSDWDWETLIKVRLYAGTYEAEVRGCTRPQPLVQTRVTCRGMLAADVPSMPPDDAVTMANAIMHAARFVKGEHTMQTECIHCKRPLRFDPVVGWVHQDGGGLYWQRCGDCDWEGSARPPVTSCPQCGGRNVRDDHCALASLGKTS